MIAFNELLSNIDYYYDCYNKMGYNINLYNVVKLENIRKDFQLKFENLRSTCNKKCHEFALKKLNNEDNSDLYNEIIFYNNTINQYNKKLIKLNYKINKILKKLPNIPDEYLKENKTIYSNNITANTPNIKSIFSNNFEEINFNKNIKHYLKSLSNVIFNEFSVNKIINCSNGIIILTSDFLLNNTLDLLLNYLKDNSLYIIQICSNNISKSSSNEYISKLNNNLSLKIEIKKEFFTREYNIKYKNKSIDMTKFVNQINLTFIKK